MAWPATFPSKIWIFIVIAALTLGYLALAGTNYWWPFGEQNQGSRIKNQGNDIATWQTYRNEQYGFEVKYPWPWAAQEITDSLTSEHLIKVQLFEPSYRPETSFWSGSFLVSVFKNEQKLSADDWIKKTEPKTPTAESLIREQSDVILNSEIPTTRLLIFNFDSNEIRYVTLSNDRIFELSYYDGGANDDKYQEHQNIYNQILSTFKFIEPTSESGEGEFCIQVITSARNLQTGEIRDFPTPCDVPDGWEQI